MQEFTNLYEKQKQDEVLTPFGNEIGFSLVRFYPKDSVPEDENLRMFIKVAILERGLFYSVDMTKPDIEGEKISYVIVFDSQYNKKVTSFVSDIDDKEFVFDPINKKIIHNKTKKEFTLNEFIGVLVKNHLSDRLFWKRKFNFLSNLVLKILFWLSDRRYEKVQVSIDKYHFSKENKPIIEEEKKFEPFFKYFYISKNLIFTILLASLFIAILSSVFYKVLPLACIWNSLFGEFSLSNPPVILFFFLALFSFEKVSVWLNTNIKKFLIPEQSIFYKHEENFIEKLHNYQYNNKFNLKI